MASVTDVATYILNKTGATSAWKLQKLVYYSQAWHATWEDEKLFDAPIQAWANGPVCRDLYAIHRGQFTVRAENFGGDPNALTTDERESIDAVLEHYGRYSGQQLSDLTHAEDPWKCARKGVPEGARSENEITVASMAEYYGSL
ncbi:MAG: DUF4065 domain-containing protein [Alphaproteobacteria bacterium]|nr:DUF4065 domain-containing protein [Alphaproteobacteria bacterium]